MHQPILQAYLLDASSSAALSFSINEPGHKECSPIPSQHWPFSNNFAKLAHKADSSEKHVLNM